SHVKGLQQWILLNRNQRYISQNTNWPCTFAHFDCDEESFNTSFSASRLKRNRIALITEELPTLSKLKVVMPQIYSGWTCERCNPLNKEETFSHLWTCQASTLIINELIDDVTTTLSRLFFIPSNPPPP